MNPPEKKNDQVEPQAIPSKVVAEQAKCPMKQQTVDSVEKVTVQDDQDHKTIAQPKQANADNVTGTVEKVATRQFEPARQVEPVLKLAIEHKQPMQEINPKQYIHGAPQVECRAKSSLTESHVDLYSKSSLSNLSPAPNFWPSNAPFPSNFAPPPPPTAAPIRPDEYLHMYKSDKASVSLQNIKSTTTTTNRSHSRKSGCAPGDWQRRQREIERRRLLLDKVIKDAQMKTKTKVAPSTTVPTDMGYVVLVPIDYKLPQKNTMKGPIVMRVVSDTAMFAPDGFVHLYNSLTNTIDLIKVQVKSKSQAKVSSRARLSRSPPGTPSPLGPDDHVPSTRSNQTVLSKGPKSKTVYRVPADTPKALFNPDQYKNKSKQSHTKTVKASSTMMKVQQEEEDDIALP